MCLEEIFFLELLIILKLLKSTIKFCNYCPNFPKVDYSLLGEQGKLANQIINFACAAIVPLGGTDTLMFWDTGTKCKMSLKSVLGFQLVWFSIDIYLYIVAWIIDNNTFKLCGFLIEIGELLIGVSSVFRIKPQITNVIPPKIILNTNSFSVTFFKVCENFSRFSAFENKRSENIITW